MFTLKTSLVTYFCSTHISNEKLCLAITGRIMGKTCSTPKTGLVEYLQSLYPFTLLVKYLPEIVRDSGHMLLKNRGSGSICIPAHQHVDGFGDLKKSDGSSNSSHFPLVQNLASQLKY